MVRSIGLVLLIVIPVWFLAQPNEEDSATIRVVDASGDIASLRAATPGAPAPGALPQGWRSTSSTLDPTGLRIGYVTPSNQYAEYVARTAASPETLPDLTGRGTQVGTFVVEGVAWRQYDDGADRTTLVREVAGVTVAVGGVRETATLEELRVLAASIG